MKWDIDRTLANFVDAMLPRFSDEKLGLYFELRLSFSDYGDDLRNEWHKIFNIEFLVIRASNYTRVLGRILDDRNDKNLWDLNKTPHEMTQQSHHDSCWRYDGFRILDECFRDVSEQYKKEVGLDSKDNLKEYHSFEHCGSPRYILLKSMEQKDPNDRWSSFIVTVEKQLTIKEAGQYLGEG